MSNLQLMEIKKRYVSRIWTNERGNTDGEAVGYLVGNYLVGKVLDSCEEYINLEWWMPVGFYEATEEPVTTYSNGRWYNPTNQEKADEWSRRIAKRGMV